MLYSLLQRLALGPLPMTFTNAQEIEHLRTLRDGGWVKVSFTPGARPGQGTATVTELTALGRVAMRFIPPE
ncbi:hypothetical protein E5CHR_04202 [Variovorax sp. PBL-E5]|nr:hypothetical protein E5CHR_04202 [Variovorax sp. PBL-E5]